MSFYAKVYVRDGVIEFAQTSTDYLDHVMLPDYDAEIRDVVIGADYMHATDFVSKARIASGALVVDGVDSAKIASVA